MYFYILRLGKPKNFINETNNIKFKLTFNITMTLTWLNMKLNSYLNEGMPELASWVILIIPINIFKVLVVVVVIILFGVTAWTLWLWPCECDTDNVSNTEYIKLLCR